MMRFGGIVLAAVLLATPARAGEPGGALPPAAQPEA